MSGVAYKRCKFSPFSARDKLSRPRYEYVRIAVFFAGHGVWDSGPFRLREGHGALAMGQVIRRGVCALNGHWFIARVCMSR